MATAELKAKLREETGKGVARRIRQGGNVPGVLYGEGHDPVVLEVNFKDFYHVTHTRAGSNVILDLKIDGANRGECKAIIREIQYHPVRRDVLHIDFQEISMSKEVHVNIPVKVIGEALGVRTKGGVLEVLHREVEVRCLPADIPENLPIEITDLDVGDSVQVKDLTFSDGEIIDEPETTVITIVAPTVIEEKPTAEEEEAAEGEEVAEGEEKEGEKKEGEKKEPEAGTPSSE
jgi:large subunit ribosomal protein L25